MVRLNQRGSSMVDYIMMTALVAGVVVPVIYVKFGAPLLETMKNERGKLVNFIGQTPRGRRSPVPSAWFSQEKIADQKTGPVNDPSQLPPGAELTEPGDLGGSGRVAGSNVKDTKGLEDPGQLGSGDLGAGNVAGGGAGGGFGSAGAAGSGSGAGGSDFFSDSPAVPGGGLRGEKKDEEVAERSGGGSSGARESSSGERLAGNDNLTRKAEGGGKNEKKEEGARTADGKKRSLLEAETEFQERSKGGQFDWWLLIKILIVILIIALVFLILVGNSRRSG